MAHIAKTNELAQTLIDTIIVSRSKQDSHAVDLATRDALQTFTSARFIGTNQYEVDAHFQGLDEKLRIFNNHELADALQDRLVDLSEKSHKWMPEILSLLLQLSDNPAEKSRIEDLDALQPDFLPAPLTWSEVIAEDPLDNHDGIWDSIDYAVISSDEYEDTADGLPTLTPAVPIPQPVVLVERFADENGSLDSSDGDRILEKTLAAQFWRNGTASSDSGERDCLDDRSDETTIIVTEAQMIRETISMLFGLPTSIYMRNAYNTTEPDSRYQIRHISESLLRQLLEYYACVGDKLNYIRQFVKRKENSVLVQTFQAAVSSRLRDADRELIEIEADILTPKSIETITLISLRKKVFGLTKPLLYLQEIINQFERNKNTSRGFRVLELLYEYSTLYQGIGEEMIYLYMAQVFLQVFQLYLKSIKSWMEAGILTNQDSDFFVQQFHKHVPPSALWQDQYNLIYDANGELHAPNFLHLSVKRIFVTGKSVSFLKALGYNVNEKPLSWSREPEFDYRTIFEPEGSTYLEDFPDVFSSALNKWIATKHHTSSQLLRDRLGSQCGLWDNLDILETIYFCCNGAISGYAAGEIFDRIDRKRQSWNDSFYLTELFREVFGVLPNIDVERLRVRSQRVDRSDGQDRRNTVKMLITIRVDYLLPWPVANIIKKGSIRIYQRIFTFLMQVERAKQTMERYSLRKSTTGAKERNRGQNALVHALRQRLLWFLHTVQSYLTGAVLWVATKNMHNDLRNAEDVDAMITVHEDYANHLEDQCLIGTRLTPIHQAILSIFDLALQFAEADLSSLRARTASTVDSSASSKSNNYRWRLTRDSDESSEDDDNVDEAPTNHPPFGASYLDRLNKMHDSFLKLHGVIVAGLQGVGRAGGEACWAILADSLVMDFRERSGQNGVDP